LRVQDLVFAGLIVRSPAPPPKKEEAKRKKMGEKEAEDDEERGGGMGLELHTCLIKEMSQS
jgi:hypothetical protein